MGSGKKAAGGDGRKDELIEALEGVRREVREMLNEIPGRPVLEDDSGIDFAKAVQRYERELIEAALRIAHGRQNEAARLLKLTPSTLSSMMKRLRIDAGDL